MTERSRRAFLARGVAGVGTAVGGVTLAGCSSVFDEEPEPIGVEEEQLREVAGIESPSVAETIPGGIDDGVVGQFRTRVDSLLEPIPAIVIRERN